MGPAKGGKRVDDNGTSFHGSPQVATDSDGDGRGERDETVREEEKGIAEYMGNKSCNGPP